MPKAMNLVHLYLHLPALYKEGKLFLSYLLNCFVGVRFLSINPEWKLLTLEIYLVRWKEKGKKVTARINFPNSANVLMV